MPDYPAAQRPTTPPGWLRRLDGRVQIILLVLACFITQYLPTTWLPLWLAFLACLFLMREMRVFKVLALARGAATFTLIWFGMKLVSDLISGVPSVQALVDALPVAGKLIALSCIGTAFVGLSSPIETGRAMSWYLYPLLRKNAWKPALVMALTAWFLPITLRLAGDVLGAMRARGLKMPWRKKALLVIGTSLRILEHRAGELAVGLASRRVDDQRTWKM